MDDSEFLRDIVAPKLNEEDCPAWADRVEQIANRLYRDEREREKRAAEERLLRSSGKTH